jgi:hypothetical protein
MASMRAAIASRIKAALTPWPPLAPSDVWPIVQASAAAATAWLIASNIVDHPDPFFAPISALVSLNASLGERGLNALRLLQGVLLGIVVGELALLALGGGYGTLALGTFVALLLAQVLGNARILRAQAGIAAILTISVADGDVGPQRLIDALIGAGVALVFSQLLFPPQPLRLLRRVETSALAAMAAGLDLTAQALDGDESLADRAIHSQRQLRDQLAELARTRRASTRVARHSLTWRTQIAPLVQENEDAGHLDLLGGSCLLLTRTSLAASDEDRRLLAPCISSLSSTLADLARQPGDPSTRQHAVHRSLQVLREIRSLRPDPGPELTVALTAARIAVTDLMLFVGVDPAEALAATREETRQPQEPEVHAPPAARKPLLRPLGHWFRRPWRHRNAHEEGDLGGTASPDNPVS